MSKKSSFGCFRCSLDGRNLGDLSLFSMSRWSRAGLCVLSKAFFFFRRHKILAEIFDFASMMNSRKPPVVLCALSPFYHKKSTYVAVSNRYGCSASP